MSVPPTMDDGSMHPDLGRGPILRLFPGPMQATPLRGLYLEEPLRPAGTAARPFVYASFIASLDGRISLPDPKTKTHKVPNATANPRDWRLFQELAAAADVVVTTGRYIRDLAAGVAQDALPISEAPAFADLIEWRRARGLAPQPAVAIVTASLNLPIPEALLRSGRPIYVVTGAATDPAHIEPLTAQGVRVLNAGTGPRVEGRALVAALAQQGFGNIDMVAGAELLNTLLVDDVFDRLYLTQACRVLGGLSFDTLLKGHELEPPARFKLRSLCYDGAKDGGVEQLFGVYDLRPAGGPGPAVDELAQVSPAVVVVMGVSGSGKTTVGALLAGRLHWAFADADDFHNATNIAKMHDGRPLDDTDRAPWLRAIAAQIDAWRAAGQGGVVTCSALKRAYRDVLIGGRPGVHLVYLQGNRALIARRMEARHGHLMPAALLASQFAALEEPTADEHAVAVSIGRPSAELVEEIIAALGG